MILDGSDIFVFRPAGRDDVPSSGSVPVAQFNAPAETSEQTDGLSLGYETAFAEGEGQIGDLTFISIDFDLIL